MHCIVSDTHQHDIRVMDEPFFVVNAAAVLCRGFGDTFAHVETLDQHGVATAHDLHSIHTLHAVCAEGPF